MAIRFSADGEALKNTAEPTNPFTVCGWAYLTTDKNYYQCLWALESGDPGANTSGQLLLTTGVGGLDLSVYDGTSSTALVTLTVGTWFRWGVTVANTPNTMIGYASTTPTGTLSSTNVGAISMSGLDRFLIGCNSYVDEYWNGRVANIHVFSSVLTGAQIDEVLWSHIPKAATSEYIWTPAIDDTVANAVKDYSGNGRDWTALGTLSIEDGPPLSWGTAPQYHLPAAAAGGTQNLDPDSIASLEAFGTAVLTVGAVDVSPSSIAGAEAFGTATLTIYLLASSVAPEEAFGTPVLTAGAVDVAPTSITGAEAFGTALLTQIIAPSSIDGAESFGSPQLNQAIAPSSVAGAESVSTDADVDFTPQTLSPSSIAGAEAFGSPQLNLIIYPDALASAENVPAPLVDDGTGGATPTLYQRRKSRFLRRSQTP